MKPKKKKKPLSKLNRFTKRLNSKKGFDQLEYLLNKYHKLYGRPAKKSITIGLLIKRIVKKLKKKEPVKQTKQQRASEEFHKFNDKYIELGKPVAYLRDRYSTVFLKAPPEKLHDITLWNAISYQLMYEGYEREGLLEKKKKFLERYERAIFFKPP